MEALNVKVVSTQEYIYRIYTLIHTEILTSRMEQGIELERENENVLHTTQAEDFEAVLIYGEDSHSHTYTPERVWAKSAQK